MTRAHQDADDNVSLMSRNAKNHVAEVSEMLEGKIIPYVSYFENIPMEYLHLSDFFDRQVVRFDTITDSIVLFWYEIGFQPSKGQVIGCPSID